MVFHSISPWTVAFLDRFHFIYLASEVLGSLSNGESAEAAAAQLLAVAKDRWADYDESYCAARRASVAFRSLPSYHFYPCTTRIYI